jgi:hypothetical protein
VKALLLPKNKFTRPATPMPTIFTRIDGIMKVYFEGKWTSEFSPVLPAGEIQHGEKRLVTLREQLAPIVRYFQNHKMETVNRFVHYMDERAGIIFRLF